MPIDPGNTEVCKVAHSLVDLRTLCPGPVVTIIHLSFMTEYALSPHAFSFRLHPCI